MGPGDEYNLVDEFAENEPDILAVEKNGCSEVYRRERDEAFQLVIVVPTAEAHTKIAVVGDPTTPQYRPMTTTHWPGRPDRYGIRVDLRNIRYSTVDKVRAAVMKAGGTWTGR
jgi:hypothetical protein